MTSSVKQALPQDVSWMVFHTPETQKALTSQGFEYGGSVEIRTLG